MFSPRRSASRTPSSHDESSCPCCIFGLFWRADKLLGCLYSDLYTVEVARLYGRLHKATLSSENPTIEFSSEFKKVINQHSGTNSTVIRIKFGFYKKNIMGYFQNCICFSQEVNVAFLVLVSITELQVSTYVSCCCSERCSWRSEVLFEIVLVLALGLCFTWVGHKMWHQ